MAATITWTEADKQPVQFIINDSAMACLEQYRLTQRSYLPGGNNDPTHPDILSMLLSYLTGVNGPVQTAFRVFPPDEIKAAVDAAAAANAALAQSGNQFISSALMVVPAPPVTPAT